MAFPLIEPTLINSSNPWATSMEDLQALFDCEHTGAVTTRTSLIHGFEHNSDIHQYAFFSTTDHSATAANATEKDISSASGGSLNTLGYSPHPLSAYLAMISKVLTDSVLPAHIKNRKPFIISVTGSAESVAECYRRILAIQKDSSSQLCMEINLSCPNIPDKPPPAYSAEALAEYLDALKRVEVPADVRTVPIGIKTPPYTYHDQFQALINALLAASKPHCPVGFITATNTLGSSLVLADTSGQPALNSASGAGIGGMAGSPLHPLALGNVKTIRSMLDQHEPLKHISVIGTGGVSDRAGFERMRAVGAAVVGVGTALGREGVSIFGKILKG